MTDGINKKFRRTAEEETEPQFKKPILIIVAGGTFLCDARKKPYKPKQYDNALDFLKGTKLYGEVKYNKKRGKYFSKDGSEIIFHIEFPSIDSTNAKNATRIKIRDIICKAIGDNPHGIKGVMIIHGTDTAAQLSEFLDLHFGRNLKFAIGIVCSQLPANAENSDAQGNFKTAMQALAKNLFKQVFVVSENGAKILRGINAKRSDKSIKIFGPEDAYIGENDGGVKRIGNSEPKDSKISEILPNLLTEDDIKKVNPYYYDPMVGGDEDNAIGAAVDEIEESISGKRKFPRTGVAVITTGSGNIPEDSKEVLIAAGNAMPVFGTSSVLGAMGASDYEATIDIEYVLDKNKNIRKDKDGNPIQINCVIPLPATRPGYDLRPVHIMGFAAKYAKPNTPEYLMFCHLFAAFAWTEEDNQAIGVKGSPIKADRIALCGAIRELDDQTDKILPNLNDKNDKEELSRALYKNGNIGELFDDFVPQYRLENGRVIRAGKGLQPQPEARQKKSARTTVQQQPKV